MRFSLGENECLDVCRGNSRRRIFCVHFLVHSLTRQPLACCMWHVVWSLCVCKASCSLHVALRFRVELTYGWARQILPQYLALTRRVVAFHSGPSFASVCSQVSEESCEKRRRRRWRLAGCCAIVPHILHINNSPQEQCPRPREYLLVLLLLLFAVACCTSWRWVRMCMCVRCQVCNQIFPVNSFTFSSVVDVLSVDRIHLRCFKYIWKQIYALMPCPLSVHESRFNFEKLLFERKKIRGSARYEMSTSKYTVDNG